MTTLCGTDVVCYIWAMTTRHPPRSIRLSPPEEEALAALTAALSRGQQKPASAADAIRLAIVEAAERYAPQAAADRAAWTRLRNLAPSPVASIVLRGQPKGEPIPEVIQHGRTPDGRPATYCTPSLWPALSVTAELHGLLVRPGEGVPVDLPLMVENDDYLGANVFLTDDQQLARVHLGPLTRVVGDDAYFDIRLHNIEQKNA